MSSESILERFMEQQGWSDATALGLLLEYTNNQQDHGTLEDFLRQKADEENEGAAELLETPEFSPQGIPILTLEAKLSGFHLCVQDGSWEDALGHMFDLMHYLCPKMTVRVTESGNSVVVDYEQQAPYGSALYFSLLHSAYGQNPVEIRGNHGETPQESSKAAEAAGVEAKNQDT
jgi:hypothetical protein